MTVEDQYAELRQEIRELALTMVRLEQCANEAVAAKHWGRVADLRRARDLVRARRSALLSELWAP
jgi:hypothetical protein